VASVRQGVVTGADEDFILEASQVPAGEEAVFRELLPDRLMARFRVPETTGRYVFYPRTINGRLSEGDLQDQVPQTWVYLRSKRHRLEGRRQVRAGNIRWWEPERPRRPEDLFQPKIV